MIPLGPRLKAAREALGLTQSELARSMGGMSRYHLTRIETSHALPSLGKLERLCAALHVDVATILASEEPLPLHLLDDPFVRENLTEWLNLTFMQRAQVLEVLRDLAWQTSKKP